MLETPEDNETTEATTEPVPAEAAPAATGPGSAAGKPARGERRAAKRQTADSTRPVRTPEERQAERDAERRRKAAARRRRRPKERARAKARRVANPHQPQVHEHGPGRPKVRQGIVTSAKPDKTITVRIDVARRHLRYEKIIRSSSTLHAHDERNDANEGDIVRVVESRPLSALKRWRLLEVLERAE